MTITFQNRLLNSLISIFFLSFSIFFRKKALLFFTNNFSLVLWFMVTINLTLFFNLLLFQKNSFRKISTTCLPQLHLIFCSGCCLLTFYTLATFGLNLVSSINYSFVSRSTLIFSIILAYFFLNEKMNMGKFLLLISFCLGIYIFSTEGRRIILKSGDLLILIATFSFSSYAIFQKKLCRDLPPNITSWVATLISVIVIIIVNIILKIRFLPQHPEGLIYILFAGMAEAMAVLFLNRTIYFSSVSYYSMMSMLTPLLNVFLGIFFLNESLSTMQIVGGLILIFSGIMVQKIKT